ncbi:MAG: tRNA pseudouridine(38-40) synthase TruA [Phycisphaerales bacterium]|nr:MAG: tRNA pseudouridine(38-40) synthase TruA [Phycisphaerales bacterium]
MSETPARRVVLFRIAYDGTDFRGWQHQPGQRTVQGVLEDVLRRVVRHPVELIGSGRTDAGVHAAGQAASLATTEDLPADKLRWAIVSRLPPDISIDDARDVHPDFHATRDAVSKMYRYRLYAARRRAVAAAAQRYTFHVWRRLDVESMKEGARHFIGTRDFSALAGRGCVRETMVRTVLDCQVNRRGDEVHVDVHGGGFLYKQVRNMVGTLLNVGLGLWPPHRVGEIIESRDRRTGGPTAPPHGLCLMWVVYPPHRLAPPTASAEPSAPT